MNPEYVNVTPQEVGKVAANLNVSGTPESLMELVFWAQRRALASRNTNEETIEDDLGQYLTREKDSA